MTDNKIVLLDYDGFVVKSYYASKVKVPKIATSVEELLPDDEYEEIDDDPLDILLTLEEGAIKRAKEYYNTDNIKILRIMSGHTFKKDIFPGYKGNRKKDEKLGEYIDWVKNNCDVIIAHNLEADDYITLVNYNQDMLVFSDDKDLRKYNRLCARINPTEEILETPPVIMQEEQLIQMITGDSIDNIKGIKGRGEVYARKLMDKNGYTFDTVVKAYKNNNVDVDECFKNLCEVIPISLDWIDEEYQGDTKMLIKQILANKFDYMITMSTIEGFCRYINKKVKEVYYNGSKS